MLPSQNLQLILVRTHSKTRRSKGVRRLFTAGASAICLLLFFAFLPYEVKFFELQGKGDVVDTNIPAADMAIASAVMPQGELPVESGLGDRYVVVSLASQTLEAYENGQRVFITIVSTGAPSRPTPKGEFTIKNKAPRAYSGIAKLWMPYWMAFHFDGQYWLGFHELPEWSDGTKEGEEHLGQAYSGGCIRLGVGPAEEFYNWAKVGDKLLVY